jgi:Predicted membrane protein
MPKYKKKFSLLDTNKKPVPFKKNRVLQAMMAVYIIVFIILSIRPVNILEWWYESIVPIMAILLLSFFYKNNRLSNTAYFCILTVLVLHAVGSHYTYTACPVGIWISRFLGTHRNDFDRLVNFSFGLLISIPVLESIYQRIRIRYIGACILAVVIILAAAALYEMLEMFSAMILSTGFREVFLAFQGDSWDPQKDMVFATLGSVISMSTCIILRLNKNHKIHMVRYRNN